ncbi:hypothetical protein QAD02_008786 [Eretmocerus hayati]|uniref:Uncharacterized protein n=1 Tax=Eretmocerus hayati TaxID=131215 RepID=A0ACC2N7V2_9HYME|nr:hypothetical protein QAD02_008786 [Eretmocerus hayati]
MVFLCVTWSVTIFAIARKHISMAPTRHSRHSLIILFFAQYVSSFIVPEEVPTLLSVIYSELPPIKTGTDSRLGVGFRFGEHADFQVVMELGPQQDTMPLKNPLDSRKRREVIMYSALRGELGPIAQMVAKYQLEQKVKKMLNKYKLKTEKQLLVQYNTTEKVNTTVSPASSLAHQENVKVLDAKS